MRPTHRVMAVHKVEKTGEQQLERKTCWYRWFLCRSILIKTMRLFQIVIRKYQRLFNGVWHSPSTTGRKTKPDDAAGRQHEGCEQRRETASLASIRPAFGQHTSFAPVFILSCQSVQCLNNPHSTQVSNCSFCTEESYVATPSHRECVSCFHPQWQRDKGSLGLHVLSAEATKSVP